MHALNMYVHVSTCMYTHALHMQVHVRTATALYLLVMDGPHTLARSYTHYHIPSFKLILPAVQAKNKIKHQTGGGIHFQM